MRVLVSMLLLLPCVVASIAWAAPPLKKAENPKPGYVYQLDTGDVVAINSTNAKTRTRDCILHVVQMDGTLHLPFAKVKARGMTIAELRDSIGPLSEAAQQHGMVDIVATIVDRRNTDNDHILQNLY